MGSYGKVFFVAVAAALAFATLMVINGGPSRVAHADPPVPETGEVWVYKDCLGVEDGIPAFTMNVDFEFGPADIDDDPALNEDTAFDFTFALDCDTALDLTGTPQWAAMLAWMTDGDTGLVASATITVTEINIPALVSVAYTDCVLTLDDLEDLALAEDSGFLCTVTNTIDLPDLTVVKECPGGAGASQFSVIAEEVGGGVAGFDNNLGCTEQLTVADLTPGDYLVREIIGGPDSFETIIECDDATGLHDELGRLILVTLDLSGDALCIVTNTLEEDDDDDGLINIDNTNNNIINVNSENTNDNANNNNNANANENANNNANNNENTNTQNQTNDQDQTNNNTQSTNVTSSPEVNISGAGGVAGSGGGTVTVVTAPSTGDGGLLGMEPHRAGLVTYGAAASVLLLVLGAAATRFVRNEG